MADKLYTAEELDKLEAEQSAPPTEESFTPEQLDELESFYNENKGVAGTVKTFAGQAADEFLMGLPEIAADNLLSPLDKAKKDILKEEHPVANVLGGVTGFAGSLGYGGPLVKGATAGAKIAENLVAKGISKGLSKSAAENIVGRALSKGVGLATEGALFSAPAALTEAATGNPKAAVERLIAGGLGNVVLGGAVKTGQSVVSGAQRLKEKTASGLKSKAEQLAVEATGATPYQMSKFSDDAGRQLLDRSLVQLGDTPEKILAKVQKAKQEAGTNLGSILDDLTSRGGEVKRSDVVNSLSSKINALSKDPANSTIVKKMNKILGEVSDKPPVYKEIEKELGLSKGKYFTKQELSQEIDSFLGNIEKNVKKLDNNLPKTEILATPKQLQTLKTKLDKDINGLTRPYLEAEKFLQLPRGVKRSKQEILQEIDDGIKFYQTFGQSKKFKGKLSQPIRFLGKLKREVEKDLSKKSDSFLVAENMLQLPSESTYTPKFLLDEVDRQIKLSELVHSSGQAKEELTSKLNLLTKLKQQLETIPDEQDIIPLSLAEKTKRNFQSQSNWAKPLTTRANKETSEVFKSLVEEAAEKLDPAVAKQFKEDKSLWGLLKPIEDSMERRSLVEDGAGLSDFTFTVGGAVSGGIPGVIASSIAKSGYKNFIQPKVKSSLAVTFDKLGKYLENTKSFDDLIPQAISNQVAAATPFALARSTDLFSSDLSKVDNSLREIEENANDLVDSHEEDVEAMYELNQEMPALYAQKVQEIAAYIRKAMPKNPGQISTPFRKDTWKPNDIEMSKFNRIRKAALQPQTVLEDLRRGVLSYDSVKTVRELYPELSKQMSMKIIEILDKNPELSYQKKQQIQMLLDTPYLPEYQSKNMKQLQMNIQAGKAQQENQSSVKPIKAPDLNTNINKITQED